MQNATAADLISRNRVLLGIAERARARSRQARRKSPDAALYAVTGQIGGDLPRLSSRHAVARSAPDGRLAGKGTADPIVRHNRWLLSLAERAQAEARRVISTSFDARIQRSFSINRPAFWADMMAAWVFARARAGLAPLRRERERALHQWRFALDHSPATLTGPTGSGPH